MHELKEAQAEVIRQLELGSDVFALLPTGYGKSLCYQWPALHLGWKVLVVSPLIALMEDQFLSLRGLEKGALRIHSGMSKREERFTRIKLENHDWNILYLSPEKLLRWYQEGVWQKLLAPELVAIDEFHCVSEWGSFRPAFDRMSPALNFFKNRGARIAAFTATLSVMKGREVLRNWGIDPQTIALPLGRENLSTFLLPCETKEERYLLLLALLKEKSDTGASLIYCPSRECVEEVNGLLNSCGISSVAFHAGLPSDLRLARVHGFREKSVNVVVATSAFGMGIDRADVELVIHYGLPWSIEGLWQEAGRAGRDGRKSTHAILWNRSDLLRIRALPKEQQAKSWNLIQLLLGQSCRRHALSDYFGVPRSNCGGCDVCVRSGQNLPVNLWSVEKFVDRTVWWLCDEAEPKNWMRDFLNIT